ncbi:MAG: hypothetical protein ACJAUZ_002855, partial [Flavobacteriaceae bacterium]
MSVQAEANSAPIEPTGEGSGVERRARLQNTIQALVKLRQEVVVSYCQLAGVSSFAARDVE